VLLETGNGQPRNLANAYLKALKPSGDPHRSWSKDMPPVHGRCAMSRVEALNPERSRLVPIMQLWAVHDGDIVAAAIPEPETYALLLAGLGLMGFVASRSKAN